MSDDMLTFVRNPGAHTLASEAVGLMQSHGVWPTPPNYELWLHVVGTPDSALAQEIRRLTEAGEHISDSVAEGLAKRFLTHGGDDTVGDEGFKLMRELASVSELAAEARKSHKAYGQVLAAATQDMSSSDIKGLEALVSALSQATKGALDEYSSLEIRLSKANSEASRLHRRIDQMRMETVTDALTGLANRKALDLALDRLCAEAGESGPLTLAFIDIDHFKKFNDNWGHQTGDQVLRYVSGVLARSCSAPRLPARYGGEEFVILFPGESAQPVEQLVNELREEISARALHRRSTNEYLGSVTMSAGIAQRLSGETGLELLSRADDALYRAKNEGRNRVSLAE